MNDYLTIFEQFKEEKEILDLIDDIKKLRFYYSTQQYDSMLQHIKELTRKYALETLVWNSINRVQPMTYDQAYQNAENFLRFKGFKMLLEKGYNLSKHLTQEEITLIQQTTK